MSSARPAPGKLGKGRRRGIRFLVAVGSILAFLTIFSVWLERQVLNTDDWVNTSAELIEDETVRIAISEYLVDELYENVDMEAELEEILPDAVKGLAGPAAGGLRQGASQGAERILRSNTAKSLWETANRAAHRELVVVLEGGDDRLSTEGGVVSLDLGAMLRDLGRQIGLSANLTDRIPEGAGQIEILRSDELKTAQEIARVIKGLALLLFLLTLLSFGFAVYLSAGQRWVALLTSAVGLVAAAFAVLIVRRVVGGLLVDRLVDDPGARPAAENAWTISTSLLASIAVSVIVFACLLALAAWLAAPAPSSRNVRRFLAPGLRDHVGYFYGGLAIFSGLYLLISPSQNLRSLITALVVIALAAFGLRELRRMAVAEFPDQPAWTGLERIRLSAGRNWRDLIERRRRRSEDPAPRPAEAQPPASPPVAPPASEPPTEVSPSPPEASPTVVQGSPEVSVTVPSLDHAERRLAQLERLAELHERGVLTDAELAAEKARLLGEGRDLP